MRGGAVPIQSKALCVVWRAKHAPAPAALTAALDRPGFHRVECDNPFAAIAHLGRARSNGQRTSLVLVLVEPDSIASDIAALLEVAERIAPGLVLWAYSAGRSPAIRQVLPSDFAAAPPATPTTPTTPPVVVAPKHRSPPSLRLAGDGKLVAEPPTLRIAQAQPPQSTATNHPAASTASDPEAPRSRFVELAMSENAPQGEGGIPGGFAGNNPERAGGKPLLSDEELAMLLSDDAEDMRA